MATRTGALIHATGIADSILVLRGQRVLLDANLAELYGVATKALNQAARRNARRFPADFAFRLTAREWSAVNRSHFVTGSQKHRNPRVSPMAFTEHGSIMAAAVLNSRRAIDMSVYVVRAFVQLRGLLSSNRALARRIDHLEARMARRLTRHDDDIVAIIALIRQLTAAPIPKRRPIGFTADLDQGVG